MLGIILILSVTVFGKEITEKVLGGEVSTACRSVGGNVASTTYTFLAWGQATGSSTITFPSNYLTDVNILAQIVATGTYNPEVLNVRQYSSFDETAFYQGPLDWSVTAPATATVAVVSNPAYQVIIPTGTSTFAFKVSDVNAPFTRLVFELGTSTSVTSGGATNIKICTK